MMILSGARHGTALTLTQPGKASLPALRTSTGEPSIHFLLSPWPTCSQGTASEFPCATDLLEALLPPTGTSPLPSSKEPAALAGQAWMQRPLSLQGPKAECAVTWCPLPPPRPSPGCKGSVHAHRQGHPRTSPPPSQQACLLLSQMSVRLSKALHS